MTPTATQHDRIENLCHRWFEANKADYVKKYGVAKVLSNYDITRYTAGKNFFHLVVGSSSAFLVDIATGIIYGNKGWLKVDRTKIVGNAYDPNFNANALVRDRFRWGHFENNADGSLRQESEKP